MDWPYIFRLEVNAAMDAEYDFHQVIQANIARLAKAGDKNAVPPK